uniref:Uncharacterized protein n=1 Tax=Arundo donax TaxID=35708 RepID=A0A0A9FZG2_ARUDO
MGRPRAWAAGPSTRCTWSQRAGGARGARGWPELSTRFGRGGGDLESEKRRRLKN